MTRTTFSDLFCSAIDSAVERAARKKLTSATCAAASSCILEIADLASALQLRTVACMRSTSACLVA
jgi:hypothetical protein